MTKAAQFSTVAVPSEPFHDGQNAGTESMPRQQRRRLNSPNTGQSGRTRTNTGHVRLCPAGNRWARYRTDTDRGLKTCPSVRSAHAPDIQVLGESEGELTTAVGLPATGPSGGRGVRGTRSRVASLCGETLRSETRLALKPILRDVSKAANYSDRTMVPRIPVISDVPVVAMVAEIHTLVWRVRSEEQTVLGHDFTEVSALHINKDALALHEMSNVLTGRGMELTVSEIGNVLASTVEKKLHQMTPLKWVFREVLYHGI